MKKKFAAADYTLWTVIALYVGVIYSTLSLVYVLRKFLVEKSGEKVFDSVYWVFVALGIVSLAIVLKKFRGRRLVGRLVSIAIIGYVYWYYLSSMQYGVERIHFLEYGLLGALICLAAGRHLPLAVSALAALCATYCFGLGDEFIQWLIPERVGEIRDSIINGLSGAFGIALYLSLVPPASASCPTQPTHLRLLCACAVITTVLTALFLMNVHGFGYRIERCDTGKFFSSFSAPKLTQINASGTSSPREQAIYANEAIRHLYQREYYLSAQFKARDGSFYTQMDRSFFENRILEKFYERFMKEHSADSCGALLKTFDSKYAASVRDRSVILPDSVKESLRSRYAQVSAVPGSRVKSTIITTFERKDLLFYVFLVLLLIAYAWVRIPRLPAGK